MNTPASFIQSALCDRVARNKSYSLRALARDLGVSHTYLSLILNGKKRVSAHQAAWFAESLGFSEEQKRQIAISAIESSPKQKRLQHKVSFHQLEMDKIAALSSWYHWAILDLTLLANFQPNVEWIAEKIGVSADLVATAAERLERLGLLERKDGKWTKTNAFLSMHPNRSEACLRRLHRTFLRKATEALASAKQVDFERRSISAAMMAVNPSRLPEAKKRIDRFRRSLIKYLSQGECTELYQLNIQLFSLLGAGSSPVEGEDE